MVELKYLKDGRLVKFWVRTALLRTLYNFLYNSSYIILLLLDKTIFTQLLFLSYINLLLQHIKWIVQISTLFAKLNFSS